MNDLTVYIVSALAAVGVIALAAAVSRRIRHRQFVGAHAPHDRVTVTLGDERVVVTRMNIAEIAAARRIFFAGKKEFQQLASEIIARHVEGAGGRTLDATTLSRPQLDKLIGEIFGNPEGSGISDFIKLLS